jgi:translation initiation factor IF-2
MSIRLNKAIRELNIGLQTAVEFLESKKNLGEITADQNFKLNDEQYRALVEAFKQDAEVRNEAEKLFQKKPKEKKHAPEQKAQHTESLLEKSGIQQFKPVGKIDLDKLGKHASATKSAAPVEKKAPEPKAAAVSQEPKKEPKPAAPKVEKPAAPKAEAPKETPT